MFHSYTSFSVGAGLGGGGGMFMEQPSVIVCKYFIRVVILYGTLQYTKKFKQYPRDLIDSIFGAQQIKNRSHSACDSTLISGTIKLS